LQLAVDLSAPGMEARAPDVAIDSAGDVVAVRQCSNPLNSIIQAAPSPAPSPPPLTCPATGDCAGVASISVAPKPGGGHAGARVKGRTRALPIGNAPFSIAAGTHRTLKIRLSAHGRKLVAAAGHHGLKAALAGTGLVPRAVVLKVAKRHH
jgi:hypothetical protein